MKLPTNPVPSELNSISLPEKQNRLVIVAMIITTTVFVACSIWLYRVFQSGNETKDWNPVMASVVHNDADIRRTARGRNNGIREWRTSITYSVAGQNYSAVIDDYLVGSDVTVYVNPDFPGMVVGSRGPKMEDIFVPVVASAGSGLFLIVLLMMAFSPSDEEVSH